MDSNLTSIKQWTESRNQKCELVNIIPADIPGNCMTDIGQCLPSQVLAYHGKNPAVNGPNCWNLALVMAGVLPSFRYSTPAEMAFFMNSPLCRQLAPNESKKPGDIGAVRSGKNEVHGFMWISDDVAFSKNGRSKESPYALQSKEGMLKTYRNFQRNECQKDRTLSCEVHVDTVRCQSMDSYLENSGNQIPKKIKETFIRLEHSDKCLTIFNDHSSAFSFPMKRNLVQSMQVLTKLIESSEFKAQLNQMPAEQSKFLRGSLLVRLQSMEEQMQTSAKDLRPCLTCGFATQQLQSGKDSL